MKKQMSPATAGKKLKLNKKTVSNLAAPGTNGWWEFGPTRKGNGCFTHRCNPSW